MVSKIFFIAVLLLLVPAARVCSEEPPQAVAQVDGDLIMLSQLDETAKDQLRQFNLQLYEIRKSVLNQMIENKLLELEAKKQGITKDRLVANVQKTVQAPTEAEIKDFYEKRQSEAGSDYEKAKAGIRDFLMRQKEMTAVRIFVAGLRKNHAVKILLPVPRVTVNPPAHIIARGNEKAPIEMTVFMDFECPYCQRESEVLKEVAWNYPDKVRIIHRDYPLPFHANARSAAAAARCADEQGKFWLYQDLIFANQHALKKEDLIGYAEKTGLNLESFKTCLDSGKFNALIERDILDGRQAGVGGTPAAIINGRFLSGAMPFAAVKEVIDEELGQNA